MKAWMFPWLALAAVLGFLAWDGAGSDGGTAVDPICQMTVRTGSQHWVQTAGVRTWFCSRYCRDEYASGKRTALTAAGTHLMRGMPTSLLQMGVAVVLLLSFGLLELAGVGRPGAGSSRLDLFSFAPFAAAARSRHLRAAARALMVAAFLGVIACGLYGNQNPSINIAPLVTWTIWWVGLVFLVLFLGKAWCWVCPWDAIAGVLARGNGLGLPWPRAWHNIWPAVGLFLALTFVELGLGITMIPRATAWIGLVMIALATISALLFDRKAFCRYACLVGRVSGLYSLFGSLELRAADAGACGTCRTLDCYRGNQRGAGCPTFEFPRTMNVSTYCILCVECVQTCPKDNIAVRLRPWSADLLHAGKPRADEAWLSLILLSMTAFHGITMTPVWERLKAASMAQLGVGEPAALALWMVAFIAGPVVLFWLLARLAAVFARPHRAGRLFVEYAYAMLPIALFYHLAHNAEHFLMEGPKVFALASDPFGWGWDLFGTARSTPAPLVSLEGLWMLQLAMVLLGHVYSLWISARITRRLAPERLRGVAVQLPMLVAMVLCSVWSLWLLNQPMTMRTSGM